MSFTGFNDLLCVSKLSTSTKDTSPNVSTGQKTDGKEESDLKEEEKKETTISPAEEKTEEGKEEAKQDSKVKEEKPGKNQKPERLTRYFNKCRPKHKL